MNVMNNFRRIIRKGPLPPRPLSTDEPVTTSGGGVYEELTEHQNLQTKAPLQNSTACRILPNNVRAEVG